MVRFFSWSPGARPSVAMRAPAPMLSWSPKKLYAASAWYLPSVTAVEMPGLVLVAGEVSE